MKRITYYFKIRYFQNCFYCFFIYALVKNEYYKFKKFLFLHSRYKHYELLTQKSNIVIEGFPRSANTYLETLIKYFNPNFKIASHSHLFLNIAMGIKLNKPVILLIRKPKDAIISAYIREPQIGLKNYIKHYYYLYKMVLNIKDKIFIIEFNDAIANENKLNKIFNIINKKYNLEIKHVYINDEINEKVFNIIERKNIEWTKANKPVEEMVSRPSEKRKEIKYRILNELNNTKKYKKLLEDCSKIYQAIIEERQF